MKPLFTRLVKIYHPDLARSVRRRSLCEEMTRHILSANEAGDDETLREIERHGDGYLEVVKEREVEAEEKRRSDANFEEIRRRFYAMQAEQSCGEWADAIPINPPRTNYVTWFLWMINPYLLTFSVAEWKDNGRLLNAYSLLNGVAWLWIWLMIWNQLYVIEALARSAGYTHDGLMGLTFVLARGVLIISALPVALPLAVLAGGAVIVIATTWLLAWIAGGVLGYFHPWLIHLPYWVAGMFLIVVGWFLLGEDL